MKSLALIALVLTAACVSPKSNEAAHYQVEDKTQERTVFCCGDIVGYTDDMGNIVHIRSDGATHTFEPCTHGTEVE